MDKYHIFISHSHKDGEIAEDIKEAIAEHAKRKKVKVRIYASSSDNKPGDEWSSSARNRLKASEELIVIVSNDAVKSHWVSAELGAAWVLNTRITPATLGNMSLKRLPSFVGKRQKTNIATKKGFRLLAETVVDRAKRKLK
jgi:hypothetical protein